MTRFTSGACARATWTRIGPVGSCRHGDWRSRASRVRPQSQSRLGRRPCCACEQDSQLTRRARRRPARMPLARHGWAALRLRSVSVVHPWISVRSFSRTLCAAGDDGQIAAGPPLRASHQLSTVLRSRLQPVRLVRLNGCVVTWSASDRNTARTLGFRNRCTFSALFRKEMSSGLLNLTTPIQP